MNALLSWFKSKNISAHTIVAFIVLVAGAIVSNQQVRDLLIENLKAHPKLLSEIIAIAGIITTYKQSSSTSGAAQQVLSDAAAGKPTPTVLGTVPPSTKLVDVPVKVEAIDHGAVPSEPTK